MTSFRVAAETLIDAVARLVIAASPSTEGILPGSLEAVVRAPPRRGLACASARRTPLTACDRARVVGTCRGPGHVPRVGVRGGRTESDWARFGMMDRSRRVLEGV